MKSIEEKAEELYSDDLEYHNFDHIINVLETAMDFVWSCFSLGIQINAQIVYYSILFHDAGFHEDHKEKGFDTKEKYSSHIAENILREYNFNDDFITKVKDCIEGTHLDKKLDTYEQKIVRAADIYNISGDYNKFIDNNIALKKEAERLSGDSIEWDKWKQSCEDIIESYLSQELVLEDDLELLSFSDIKDNLNSLMNEDESKLKSREEVLFPKE